jgi:integrase
MRLGELLGLRWQDVDLDGGQLHIAQTLSTLNGRIILDEPKTATSRRLYELSPQAADALKAHKARQAAERLAMGEYWTPSGLVMVTDFGTPVDPSNFRRVFTKVSKAAGIEGCHSSISVTKDVYGHLVAGERRKATDAIAEALYGA